MFLLTAAETKARLDAGEQVRQDSFFEAGAGGRSTAEEITEGVFLAAQREYEERKLPYLATLLTSFAFSPDIDRAHAVALLRVAQALSHRQLCLIAFYTHVVDTELPQLVTAAHPDNDALGMLISELSDLAARGIVVSTATWDGGQAFFGPAKSDRLTRSGEHLYSLMRLDRIPSKELDAIFDAIRPAESNPSTQ